MWHKVFCYPYTLTQKQNFIIRRIIIYTLFYFCTLLICNIKLQEHDISSYVFIQHYSMRSKHLDIHQHIYNIVARYLTALRIIHWSTGTHSEWMNCALDLIVVSHSICTMHHPCVLPSLVVLAMCSSMLYYPMQVQEGYHIVLYTAHQS